MESRPWVKRMEWRRRTQSEGRESVWTGSGVGGISSSLIMKMGEVMVLSWSCGGIEVKVNNGGEDEVEVLSVLVSVSPE